MTPLIDKAARRRVLEDLETNFLVEAGAGSGKTEALTQRMLRLIARHGGDLSKVVAITFTRKAASEMRQRVQEGLETAVLKGRWGYRAAPGQLPEETVPEGLKPALENALRGLERLQITTIHAFCARLLMAVPLPVGLHPGFRVLQETEGDGLLRGGFLRWLEEDTAAQAALEEMGTPFQSAADLFVSYAARKDPDLADVTADVGDLDLTGALQGLRELRALAEASRGLLKDGQEDDFHGILRRTLGWPAEPKVDLLGFTYKNLLAELLKAGETGENPKPKTLGIQVTKYADRTQADPLFGQALGLVEKWGLADFVRRWREWRHAHLLELFGRALDAGYAARLRQGLLTFGDLLRCALAALDDEGALRRLRSEIECVLIDEFQDTDPLQLKLAMSLAGRGTDRPGDWREAKLRPGSIFLVGDPKQSIYRFRRADIGLYLQVRSAAETGSMGLELLSLNTNFRSGAKLLGAVNGHFAPRMRPTDWQAEYQPMVPGKDPGKDTSGAFLLEPLAELADGAGLDALVVADAARTAALVRHMTGVEGVAAGEVLILTWGAKHMGAYAQALEAAGIQAQVSGSKDLGNWVEMADFARALWSLAWPRDQAALVGVLRGLWFGLDEAQLADWAQRERPEGSGRWRAPEEADPWFGHPVAKALRHWEELRRAIRGLPATAVAERLVLREGLVLQAARAESDRELRLGALWKQVESWKAREAGGERLRLVALAQEARDLALHVDDQAETKLEGSVARPGATNAVRLMNLHKAKGLEAEVVILAEPVLHRLAYNKAPTDLVLRGADGNRFFFAPLNEFGNGYQDYLPPDWSRFRGLAESALEAERLRLLYVAATRAKRLLFISQASPLMTQSGERSSMWEYPWENLTSMGETSAVHPIISSETKALGRVEAQRRMDTAFESLSEASLHWTRPGWAHRKPSDLDATANRPLSVVAIKVPSAVKVSAKVARDFGDAFHALLEAVTRRLPQVPSETQYMAWAAGLGREFDLPEDASAALVPRLKAVMTAPFWDRLGRAKRRLVEFPLLEVAGDMPVYTEAKLDLAFEEEDGWVVADWKSGRAARAKPEDYAPQLSEYARLLELGLRVKVKECLLVLV